jgi:hypothetical protein
MSHVKTDTHDNGGFWAGACTCGYRFSARSKAGALECAMEHSAFRVQAPLVGCPEHEMVLNLRQDPED